MEYVFCYFWSRKLNHPQICLWSHINGENLEISQITKIHAKTNGNLEFISFNVLGKWEDVKRDMKEIVTEAVESMEEALKNIQKDIKEVVEEGVKEGLQSMKEVVVKDMKKDLKEVVKEGVQTMKEELSKIGKLI